MPARPWRPFDRIVTVVLDSVGCGHAPDADDFGDAGANTLGHIIESVDPALPNLTALGLDRITGIPWTARAPAAGAHGRMVETATAKDTMTGHWELMGLVSDRRFPTYPDGFPDDVIADVERAIGSRILGNRAASGTEIIVELGPEHVATGAPIVYTSADSVFQIAAHEDVIPVARLYAICEQARRILTGPHGVGRVIARPFVGSVAGGFSRTSRRRDFALPPPAPTALDRLSEAGFRTHGVGKIHDIFAGQGLSTYEKTSGNAAGIVETCRALRDDGGDFIFTNLVDFDSLYGHRRDPRGYARCLEEFDRRLPGLLHCLRPGDCLFLTADHGNDPTHRGTDHTRECVPLLAAGSRVKPVDLGTRATFAELGHTILENFGVSGVGLGGSFLDELVG